MKKEGGKNTGRTAALIIGLVMILLFGLVPPPDGLNKVSMQVIGIFAGTIVLWLGVSTDWPSLVCILALIAFGIVRPDSAFATLLGNSTCAFLVFSYTLADGLTESGVLRRLAVCAVSLNFVKGHPWRIILMLVTVGTLISLVIIPSTMIIIILPVIEQVFENCGMKGRNKLTEVVVLAVAFAGSVAQGMTPIGHAHPLIALSLLEQETGYAVQYFDYMIFAIPAGILTIVIMMLYFRFVVNPDVSALENGCHTQSLGPMSTREKFALGVFIVVVIWWIAPGLLGSVFPEIAAVISSWGNAVPAMLGTVLLCVVPVDGAPLIKLGKAAKSVPWPVVFMVGATMVLSGALTEDATGITNWIGKLVSSNAESISPLAIVTITVVWTVLQTNFSSNAVSAALVYSIMVPIAMITGSVNHYALAAVIGSASCYAFATPLSTAVVAIACGSKWVSGKGAWKHGLVVMIVGMVFLTFVGYPIAKMILT